MTTLPCSLYVFFPQKHSDKGNAEGMCTKMIVLTIILLLLTAVFTALSGPKRTNTEVPALLNFCLVANGDFTWAHSTLLLFSFCALRYCTCLSLVSRVKGVANKTTWRMETLEWVEGLASCSRALWHGWNGRGSNPQPMALEKTTLPPSHAASTGWLERRWKSDLTQVPNGQLQGSCLARFIWTHVVKLWKALQVHFGLHIARAPQSTEVQVD